MPVPLLDGNMGSSVLGCRDRFDKWWCTVSILQLVSRLSDRCVLGRHRLTHLDSIISFFGTVAIALSLAEVASIWPTAGGKSRRLYGTRMNG